ncbi:exported protein of unknown function [Candidatus Nitrosocosmicus arcticus]|uniref:Uncharacterized protein n=1 Tax=Candidatus Nitrosocosmicus arcticus TaxID=2035267 RepID=A0A557SRK4_9ARCH|nr:exported protein of unknown function [Candidatus Nitrosocosmicus arcticus]
MNSNIRNLGIMFVSFAMVVGVASMAPIQSVQAEWLDVDDFGCVGVNNCNPETCTDTSGVETGVDQTSSNNSGAASGVNSFTLAPVAPFTCSAGETEVEGTDVLPPTTLE